MDTLQDFGSYMNKMFFDVFSSNPHPSIHKFINDFASVLLHPPENTGNWTAYPPDFKPPVLMTHSFIFDKHPYINAEIRQGEFKIETPVYNDDVYQGSTVGSIHVTLGFDRLEDAKKLFDELREDLVSVTEEDTYYEDKFSKFLQMYSKESVYDVPCGVRIHLLTVRGFDNLYPLRISV